MTFEGAEQPAGPLPPDAEEVLERYYLIKVGSLQFCGVTNFGLSFWDGMLWATANRAGCRMLFSEDLEDGRRLDGVLFCNPFVPENQKLVDLALPELPRR